MCQLAVGGGGGGGGGRKGAEWPKTENSEVSAAQQHADASSLHGDLLPTEADFEWVSES